MKTIIVLLICSLLISCCTMPPEDITPVWSDNNRYAVEMENDCNLTNHSLGLNGCAFIGNVGHKKIVFPKMLDGYLSFESTVCSDFTVITSADHDTIVYLDNIYDSNFHENCSYEITQKAYNIGEWSFDHLIRGRLFIKHIQQNAYYRLLNFDINSDHFNGVGWHQLKYNQSAPMLNIKTSGTMGTFDIRCGDITVYNYDYNSNNFSVDLDGFDSCDYELVAINLDSPYIEFGTLVYEKQGNTIDLTPPETYIKAGKRYFEFNDKNDRGENVVVAVQVNEEQCIKKHYCRDKLGLINYTVRAATMAGRVFYGQYDAITNNWEVIK